MVDSLPAAPPEPVLLEKDPALIKSVDERISFDQNSKRWIYEDVDNGEANEFYYDFEKKEWVKCDADVNSATSLKRDHDDDELDKEEEENKELIKRAKNDTLRKMKEEQKLQEQKSDKGRFQNTGVYVCGLPDDATKEEVVEVFSKCGLISEDFKTGEPRVKFYYEGERFKNEALIIYHNAESVDLAIDLLNDAYFRHENQKDSQKLQVTAAQFNNSNKDKVVEKKKLSAEQKRLIKERKESLKRELTSWDDAEDPNDKLNQIKNKMYSKIVVLKNMFREEEIMADAMLELDLKEDIYDECAKLGIEGDITNVTVYNISGVVTVKFKVPESSTKCIDRFNGRFFDGLKLEAFKYSGEKFERTKEDSNDADRLENFGSWIEKKK